MLISEDNWQSLNFNGEVLKAEWGQSFTVVNDYCYVFGGLGANGVNSFSNDMYSVFLPSLKITKMKYRGITPEARANHTMNLVTIRDLPFLVMIGGNPIETLSADIFKYSIIDNMWSVLDTKGSIPPRLVYHSANTVKENLVVYGGRTANKVLNGRLYVLSLPNEEWLNLINYRSYVDLNDFGIQPRMFHCSTVVNENIYIFGGVNDINETLKDLNIIHLDKLISLKSRDSVLNYNQDHHLEFVPIGRWGASMISFNETIILFGGTLCDRDLDEFSIFNTYESKWKLVKYHFTLDLNKER